MTRHRDPPGTKAQCRTCKAPIVWVVTEAGKPMCCDYEDAPGGLFYLFRRHDRIEAIHVKSKSPRAARAEARNQRRHHSHFSTCPDRDEHRRR